MHSHSEEEQFIPLSKASDLAGVTPEHLNLLARKGKLKAQKIGRNWFTTKKWLDQHFRSSPESENPDDLEIRKLQMQERLELARLNAEIQKREIEKNEKLELARLHVGEENSGTFVVRPTQKMQGNGRSEQQDEMLGLMGEVLQKFNTEKKDLADVFSQELSAIKDSRRLEQGERRALIFAFENLQAQVREDIDRRVSSLANELNEKLNEIFISRSKSLINDSLIEDLQNQSEAQINELQKEKEEMASLFAEQLSEIKKELSQDDQMKEDLLSRLEKEKNEALTHEQNQNLEKLEQIKKQMQNAFSYKEATSEEVQSELNEREIQRITLYFSDNLTIFPRDVAFPELKKCEIKTSFLSHNHNAFQKVVATRDIESRLLVPDWKREALELTGTHFIAKHSRFVSQHPSKNREMYVIQSPWKKVVMVVGIAGLLALFMLSSFDKSMREVTQKSYSAITKLGTEKLFVSEVGERFGELVIKSTVLAANELSRLIPKPTQAYRNILTGSLETGGYALKSIDDQIAGSKLLSGKHTKSFETAFSTFQPKVQLTAVHSTLQKPLIDKSVHDVSTNKLAIILNAEFKKVILKVQNSYSHTFSAFGSSVADALDSLGNKFPAFAKMKGFKTGGSVAGEKTSSSERK